MILKSNFTICDVINFRLELIWQRYHIFLIFLIFNFFKFLPKENSSGSKVKNSNVRNKFSLFFRFCLVFCLFLYLEPWCWKLCHPHRVLCDKVEMVTICSSNLKNLVDIWKVIFLLDLPGSSGCSFPETGAAPSSSTFALFSFSRQITADLVF